MGELRTALEQKADLRLLPRVTLASFAETEKSPIRRGRSLRRAFSPLLRVMLTQTQRYRKRSSLLIRAESLSSGHSFAPEHFSLLKREIIVLLNNKLLRFQSAHCHQPESLL